MTGAQGLLQSRRFWTLLIDIVLSIALYFVGKYQAVALDDLKFLIVTLQPIFALLIGAFTIDDNQQASLASQLQMHTNTLHAQADQQRLAMTFAAQSNK